MATPAVRKSGRIKSRKKSFFSGDECYEYDTVKFDPDVSQDISNLLNSHSKEKNGVGPEQEVNESMPNVARKLRDTVKVVDQHSGEKCSDILLSEADVASLYTGEHWENEYSHHPASHESHSKRQSGQDFDCDQCDRVFTDLAAFKRHLKGHSGERPFKCGQCEKTFMESCSLKRHMKTHEDERPFACDLCFKSFRDSTSFSRHQLTHIERPRSFQCSFCDKNFTDKSGLKRHERTHSGLRPYECTICHKTFSESGSFRRHQKIHVGVRNHHCPRCQRSFMEKQSLVRHQKTVCGFWEAQDANDVPTEEGIASFSALNHGDFQDRDGSNGSSSIPPNDDSRVSSFSDSLSSKNDLSLPSSLPPTSVYSQQNSSPVSSSARKNKKLNKESPKCPPSLGSLIQEDPNLYDSISEIVDSIDSYEKMLDLCGDNGNREIEAALTREPTTMPDNLMCFECGELLVDGENFSSEGKSFNSCSSFRCLNCEEDEDKYGEPPILTAEEDQIDETLSTKDEEGLVYMTNDSVECEYLEPPASPGTTEGEEHSKRHRNKRHQTNFYEAGRLVTKTRSNLDDIQPNSFGTSKYSEQFDLTHYDEYQTIPCLIPGENAQSHQAPQSSRDNAANLEYEADDPNIPSVFPCHLCTKVFATSAFLEQHLELHRKSPYKCMVCNKNFGGSPALKRHMRVHTGEKPYSCSLCKKKFRDPSNFGKHKRFCSLNISVPSPIDSTSSANSITSTASMEESLDDGSRNIEDDHLRLTFEKTSPLYMTKHNSGYVHEEVKAEITGETAMPIMAVTPSIDDFEEQFSDTEMNLDDANQQIDYIPCEICQKLCESQQHLEMHMNYHNGNPDVTCIECGKSFSDCHGLKRHMRIHAASRPFVCEYCSRGYCDNWSLKKHKSRGCLSAEVKVPVDFLHPCLRCSRVFSEADLLEDHMKGHKGKLKFECDICLKKFSEAFNLRRHRRLHMTICPGCGKEFKDISEMKKHQKDCNASTPAKPADDSSKSFPCPDCGRTYSTLAYLERHRKFHSELKLHVCEICNKKFAEAFKLRRHKRVHTESKPYVCQDCGKGFADEAYLKRHTINSSCTISKSMKGSMTFPCQYCDKVFTKNYMLVRHMNVHSQERPFSCDVCGRAYKDTSSLKRHQLVHQGVKGFICSVCGKEFFYADSLKRHMSGKCGKKSSKSMKYRLSKVNRQNGIHDGMQDSINNNNKNHNDNGDFNFGSDIGVKNENMKIKSTEKSKLLTLPYKPKTMNDCPKIVTGIHRRSKIVKLRPWSCRNKKHCWQCDTKMPSRDVLMSHVKIHQHKQKFLCLHCFARFSRKIYWKAHQSVCSLTLKMSKPKNLLTNKSPNVSDMTGGNGKRPRRSIPRARWSWLTQI